ncbi:MAG: exodeoxyribonuclease VII small subunit [Gammaproteobacteria bacterium]|jgi:exodeoxyribonuclease VII small subunit
MNKKKNDASLESHLNGLEKIVSELENGELSLEESLKKFEEGVKLTKNCQQIIDDAEKRIKIITKEGLKDFKDDLE